MKIYIVTETNEDNNLLLRSWVCFTQDEANECLKKQYRIACAYNTIAGVEDPTNCLELGFFFFRLQNGMTLRYNIVESKTFAE